MASAKQRQRKGWESLPAQYSKKVKALQEALNRGAVAITDTLPQDQTIPITRMEMEAFVASVEGHEAKISDLLGLRDLAAKIRSDGYSAGYSDDVMSDEPTVYAGILNGNPYPVNTGATECWIRGYCAGRSRKRIVNPTEYLEMFNANL